MDQRTSELLDALRAAREEAEQRVAEFEGVVEQITHSRGDADTDDEHDPEGSTVAWDRATQASATVAAQQHLAEIDAAITRVEGGWDGSCAGCGAPIPRERLAARPSADRCVRCAAGSTKAAGA